MVLNPPFTDNNFFSYTCIESDAPVRGPLRGRLYLIYTDDLAAYLDNDLHIFANDSTLHVFIKNLGLRDIYAESLRGD